MANAECGRAFEIILEDRNGGVLPPRLGPDSRKKIRSHAMRDFRRRQREAKIAARQASDSGPPHGAGTSNSYELTRRSKPGEGDPSGRDLTITHELGGGDFSRYILAELFGASLIGESTQSIRSAAISSYRQYIATTKSAAIRATDDGLCLLLPACTLNDRRILMEARVRHLAAIQYVRRTLESDTPDAADLIACAVELCFFGLFQPLSSDSESLYDGVAQLARTHIHRLRTARTGPGLFMLVQLRQMLLLRSLARASALPVAIDMWQNLPEMSSLLPEMTETLMQLAIQLPSLLSAARDVRNCAGDDLTATEQSLLKLLSFERDLLQWQVDYCTEPFHSIIRPPISRLRGALPVSRDDEVLEGVGLSHGHPILSIYGQTMCHICLLLLRESVTSLSAAIGDAVGSQSYKQRTTKTADTLCQLTTHLVQLSDGLLGKALSACTPFYFARQWYQKIADSEATAWVGHQEARIQQQVPFLSWNSLVPVGLVSLYMQT